MENKYYLQSAELIDDQINGQLYYLLVYSNGIQKRTDHIKFEDSTHIKLELTLNN